MTTIANIETSPEPLELELIAHSREQMAASQTSLIDCAKT